MALITCPECGRERVSSTADACPGCGFGIKKYFESEQIREDLVEEKVVNKTDVNSLNPEECKKYLECKYGINKNGIVNEIDMPVVKIQQKNGNLCDAKLVFDFDKYEAMFVLFETDLQGHTKTYRVTDSFNELTPILYSSDLNNDILNISGRKFVIEDDAIYSEYAMAIVYMEYLVEQDKQRRGVSDLKIIVNGKKYTYSRVVKDYLSFVPEFQKMHTALVNAAVRAVNVYDVDNLSYDWDDIYKKIISAAKSEQTRIRRCLAQKMSVSIDKIPEPEDFDSWIHFTASYKILSKYGDFIETNQKKIGEVYRKEWMAMEKAYYEAETKVNANGKQSSGSYGIITNSLLSYWTFEILSAVNEYEQEKKAQRDWEKAIQEANRKYGVTDGAEKNEVRIMTQIIFPEAFPVINEYVATYFDDFMKQLWFEHMLEYTAIPEEHKVIADRSSSTIGITKAFKESEEILRQVDIAGDKKKILQEAMVLCPYNATVYKKMIEYKVFDMQAYEVAKYFEAEMSLKEPLKNYCLHNVSVLSTNEDIVKVLAILSNATEENIIASVNKANQEYKEACLRKQQEVERIQEQINDLQNSFNSLSSIHFMKRKKISEEIEVKQKELQKCQSEQPILKWK